MSIKYNEFGEVISVNGITTGQHLGTPTQDKLGTPETNCCYAEELATVTSCGHTIDDKQPTPSGGNSGGGGSPMTPITYAELKALRDSGKLVAGMFYRITDYVCTSVQAETRAMNNRFDIIVQALATDKLSETAKATYHEGDTYFTGKANLPAWELKYSLDNDTTRFAWAMEGQAIVNMKSTYSNGNPLVRQPAYDNGYNVAVERGYIYAWGTQADVDDDDPNSFVYSTNETLTNGEIVWNGHYGVPQSAEVIEGKGVIYYMKDEHGNECPYDFKNIQFKRSTEWQEEHSSFVETSLCLSVGDVEWFYTFSWVNEDLSVDDLTMRTDLTDDEGVENTVNNNKVSEFIDVGIRKLNDNIFVSAYSYEPGYTYGFMYNTLDVNCYNNTFGCSCYYNTIGKLCSNNRFSTGCNKIKFHDECCNNRIGAFSFYMEFGCQCNDNDLTGSGDNVVFDNRISNVRFTENVSNTVYKSKEKTEIEV